MSETRKAFEALQGIDAREESPGSPATATGVPCVGPAGGLSGPAVSGRRVRFGGSNQPSGMDSAFPPGFGLAVEPYQPEVPSSTGAQRDASAPAAVVGQERCPTLDLYDESDHVLVLAELPGVDPRSVEVILTGDMLELAGVAPHRRYRAEVLLPEPFGPESLSHHLRQDLLSIRLQR